MQPITLVVIHLMRPSSSTVTQLDWKTLAFVPAALLGAWLGLRIFKRLSDRQFELAVTRCSSYPASVCSSERCRLVSPADNRSSSSPRMKSHPQTIQQRLADLYRVARVSL